jgi:simple sugar transport system permease protein
MMNYIALELSHYLVNDVLRDQTSGATATPPVQASARLINAGDFNPLYSGTNLSAGLILALLAALAVAFLIRRTALGFEIRAVGLGAEAARANGISVGRTVVTAMTLSGMLAGLAGSVEVLGVHRRFLDSFSPGYGFDSIAVALLGGLNAGGVTLSALLFGALGSGSLNMEVSPYVEPPIPRQISGIVQAAVILAVAARFASARYRRSAPHEAVTEPAK